MSSINWFCFQKSQLFLWNHGFLRRWTRRSLSWCPSTFYGPLIYMKPRKNPTLASLGIVKPFRHFTREPDLSMSVSKPLFSQATTHGNDQNEDSTMLSIVCSFCSGGKFSLPKGFLRCPSQLSSHIHVPWTIWICRAFLLRVSAKSRLSWASFNYRPLGEPSAEQKSAQQIGE